ncbi:MAG TPA: DUF6252 family protein [Flavobacterium sp.]|nr:DUF6252 family protein [Flavobacterium sp.]
MYQLDNNTIMKKIFIFLGLAVAFASCEDEVAFNETTFQAKVDVYGMDKTYTHQFRFDPHMAYIENGNLLIKGYSEKDTLEISIPNYTFGTRYELSNDNFSAKFTTISEDSVSFVYNTNTDLTGYVFLNAVEEQTPGSISGNFVFDIALDGSGSDDELLFDAKLRFHEGVMLNIPIHNTPPEVIEEEEEVIVEE